MPNQLYKGAVIRPFVRGDDGNAYRVSRNQYGNQHYFNIADGADRTDFHTDPQTGEQFVQVPGADGTSRRETVGQDNSIPAANGIRTLAQRATRTRRNRRRRRPRKPSRASLARMATAA